MRKNNFYAGLLTGIIQLHVPFPDSKIQVPHVVSGSETDKLAACRVSWCVCDYCCTKHLKLVACRVQSTMNSYLNGCCVLSTYASSLSSSLPPAQGHLSARFGTLVQKIWSGRFSALHPQAFKTTLGLLHPQFSGSRQVCVASTSAGSPGGGSWT